MNTKFLPAVAMLCLAAACSPAPAAAKPAETDRVALAVTVHTSIKAAPDKVDSILAAYDLTVQSFEALLQEIAVDSAMSARYTIAVD